jgi:hypothetical protein
VVSTQIFKRFPIPPIMKLAKVKLSENFSEKERISRAVNMVDMR